MYTNILLEEKYKAQKTLSQKAKELNEDYFTIVEKEVIALYKKMGWKIKYAKRKGGWKKLK